MRIKDEDEKTYKAMKARILSELPMTMDNWACLDKQLVNDIIEDFLDKTEIEDGSIYYDGHLIRNFTMLVANIKRTINGRC